MKKQVQKLVFSAIGIVGIMILAVGCRQEQVSDKKARLIAAENIELKREVASRDTEMEKLKELHQKEIERQEKILVECKERNGVLEKELKQDLEERVSGITSTVMNENAKLREEINNLKAEIQKLKRQVESGAGAVQSP